MAKRNIVIVTGTRAEFGIWTPVVRELERSELVSPKLVVTGIHLQKQFGHTIDDIKASRIPIAATAEMYRGNETAAESLARGTVNITKALRKLKPGLVMVLGDRLEMLAAANAALALQLPIAHVHGGETAPGQWDEQIRHAITKMAHIHFCSTQTARDRIQQMGENPKSIHVIGAPALDLAREEWRIVGRIASKVRRYRRMGVRGEAAVVVLHPSSASVCEERERAASVLRALEEADVYPEYVIGPNNDPGHEGILHAYRDAGVKVEMSVGQGRFWSMLASCSFLIGNSSSGIIEAASFHIPVINLGDRQKGRERNANVIDVPWSSGISGIRRAIDRAVSDPNFRQTVAHCKNIYGDGRTAERLRKVLELLKFPLSTVKQFCDR